jgi:hypothetical protein
VGELSSLREESVTSKEKAYAIKRMHKLHGKHFGRSLSLESELEK